ncbi:methyltransferase domain-containing protein [Elongatibacter sediminis]|uniref:Malonyl-[acyl-carrier protein] O-methyltransferase n=1 Tax=Elongatibacter sediminis TaxID=3119006 RepID=A0AAW9R920_9GAMM
MERQAEWTFDSRASGAMEQTGGSLADESLRGAFERLADAYDRHAVLEREVGDRLLERAGFQRREPERILDLGCGTGYGAEALKRRYRKAEVVAVDFSPAMCERTRVRSRMLRPLRLVCGDFHALPLASRTMDLIFANLGFQWSGDLPALFNGLRRVIRPGGLLLFSCLGPVSLRELRQALPRAGYTDAMRSFPDMHDIGDALVAAGFDEPVMDAEVLTLEYRTFDALLQDLRATAAHTHVASWESIEPAKLQSGWPVHGQSFTQSWEIVYGAAFGPAEGRPVRTASGDVATFSVEALRRGPGGS